MTSFALSIEHNVTHDLDDGQPCPPVIEDGVAWRVVRRAGGRTWWRRLLLKRHRGCFENAPLDPGITPNGIRDRAMTAASQFLLPPGARRRGIKPRAPSKPRIRIISMDMTKYSSGEHFVKVEDVRDGSIQSGIAVVKDGKYDKPNIILETGDALSLNTTNLRTLVRAYGSESDYWIGKQIELVLGEIEYQGAPREAVLVKPISPSIKKKETKETNSKPTPKLAPDMDDEVPF